MRIALISDLHANEVALKAVLADIERTGADRTICLGDVATLGPAPESTIRILRDLGCPCIRGNHEDFLLKPGSVRRYTDTALIHDAVDWCRERLSERDLEFLKAFRYNLEIDMGGGFKAFLYHGSPRSNTEDILCTTPPGELDEILAGQKTGVMAGGHSHIQMLRQHRGTLVVNPGSVGVPFKEYVKGCAPVIMAHAEYATIEAVGGRVEVNLKRVPLDRKALCDAVRDCDNPICRVLLQQYSAAGG